jgi:Uma2 family endonuclease
MGMPVRKERQYTYADYLTWPENERWELFDGIPYNMSPAPSLKHQRVLRELFRQIANYLVGKSCEVFPAPFDVRLPIENESDEEVENIVQPDISVICDRSKLDKKGCRGAPDFVIEILSPSSSRKDRMVKFYTYERFGVKEYWLVSPEDKTVEVFILGDDGKYSRPEFYTETHRIQSKILDGLKIDLEEVFIKVPGTV